MDTEEDEGRMSWDWFYNVESNRRAGTHMRVMTTNPKYPVVAQWPCDGSWADVDKLIRRAQKLIEDVGYGNYTLKEVLDYNGLMENKP